MDQCKHCIERGDLKKCESVECGHHENWYTLELKSRITVLEQREANLIADANHQRQSFVNAEAENRSLKKLQKKLVKLVKDGMARMHRYGEFQRYHLLKSDLQQLLKPEATAETGKQGEG